MTPRRKKVRSRLMTCGRILALVALGPTLAATRVADAQIAPALSSESVLDGFRTPAGVFPQAFGARCDGVNDDTAALQAWARSISERSAGRLAAGACLFRETLVLPAVDGGSIIGVGSGASKLVYTGDDARSDLVVLPGLDGKLARSWTFAGFAIDSRTRMSEGAAFHLRNVTHTSVRDIRTAGQVGSRNLWNGMWFDKVDQVAVDVYDSTARNDGVRVNGSTDPAGPRSDLYLSKGKISESGVGLHVGGAFGGLMVDMSDIEANDVNLLVDSKLAPGENRELTFGPTAAFDSARSGPNVDIDDPRMGTSGMVRFSGTWSASSKTENVRIRAGFQGIFRWEGGDCFNAARDCIRIDSPTARVLMNAVLIRNNRHFGVNLTVRNPNISIVAPFLIDNGADFGGFAAPRR
jgi:hypothetical protein